MSKKHVIILGGGISGLSARYYLTKKDPTLRVTLLEKERVLGGLMQTQKGEFFFEKAPRTFKVSTSPTLLSLINALGLTKQCIFSSRHSKNRFLWKEGKLHKLPSNPLELLTSPLTRKALFPLLLEWSRKSVATEDETIYSFAKRRLGKYVAETFFDPLTLGIYAGDIKKLSIRSCLPILKKWEEQNGSLTRALFSEKKGKKRKGLFTIKEGLKELISALLIQGNGEVHTDFEVRNLSFHGNKIVIQGIDREVVGTHLISALPVSAANKLLAPHHTIFSNFFQTLETVGLTVVNLAYNQTLIKKPGFGYLVPSKEKSAVLGTIFDSSIFPEQNLKEETRMSVMLGGAFHPSWAFSSKEACTQKALEGIKQHLKIDQRPSYVSVSSYPEVLPQLAVGHTKRVDGLLRALSQHFPHLSLIGNYLHGVSVESCLCQAKQVQLK